MVGAVCIIPWLRARCSPDCLTLLANLLLVLVYVLMAFVRQTELFFVVAALAGVGWTLSASELWVAAQRAMPSRARGRMNATVIMVSQGTMDRFADFYRACLRFCHGPLHRLAQWHQPDSFFSQNPCGRG